jgi:hypothetical protein
MAKDGDLQVWWIPQLRMKSFDVPVNSIIEALLIIDTLGKYDAFQFENRIKPDYCNTGGLNVWENGEWCEWENDVGLQIDDLRRHALVLTQ